MKEAWEFVPLPIFALEVMLIHTALPRNWWARGNGCETEEELRALLQSARRGLPNGDDRWVQRSALRLGLETTNRPRGVPRKET